MSCDHEQQLAVAYTEMYVERDMENQIQKSRDGEVANHDYDTEEFKDFLNKNYKLKDAIEDIQILYFETSKMLAPATLLAYDCYRDKERQKELVRQGKSETENSLHNFKPSLACDHIPVLNDKPMWKDYLQLHFIYGMMYVLFQDLKKKYNWHWQIRSGMDWEMNNYTQNKTSLYDPGHIEFRPLDYRP